MMNQRSVTVVILAAMAIISLVFIILPGGPEGNSAVRPTTVSQEEGSNRSAMQALDGIDGHRREDPLTNQARFFKGSLCRS